MRSIHAPRRLRVPSRGTRGFKLLEVLIAMAVLSISAAGLVKLHSTVVRNIARSEDISVAMDIASTRGDQLALLGTDGVPACGPGAGCVAAGLGGFLPQLAGSALPDGTPYSCTKFVDAADVHLANNTEQPAGTRYRVDASIDPHPDAVQPGAQIVTVSVCWMDLAQVVRQVQVKRVLVPGV